MNYNFSYRRNWFWKTIKAMGHGYDEKQNKMVIYLPDGSIQEIKEWSKCEVKLGTDWLLAQKKAMEDKIGQAIPTRV